MGGSAGQNITGEQIPLAGMFDQHQQGNGSWW